MDPNTGNIYTDEEAAALAEPIRKRLIGLPAGLAKPLIEERRAEARVIARGNSSHRARDKARRRARNKTARASRKRNR